MDYDKYIRIIQLIIDRIRYAIKSGGESWSQLYFISDVPVEGHIKGFVDKLESFGRLLLL
jgi:hypothetical protein